MCLFEVVLRRYSNSAHAACAFLWDQQHSLLIKVTWRPVKHGFIEFCLIYCTCEQKHRFCWLPSVSYHAQTDELKNIWSEIEMIKCPYCTWYEVWKWTCIGVPRRVPQLVGELDFEELALNMESLYAKQTRTDFVAQTKLIAFYWKT